MANVKQMMCAVYRNEHAIYVAYTEQEAKQFIARETRENVEYAHIPLKIVREEWLWPEYPNNQ